MLFCFAVSDTKMNEVVPKVRAWAQNETGRHCVEWIISKYQLIFMMIITMKKKSVMHLNELNLIVLLFFVCANLHI